MSQIGSFTRSNDGVYTGAIKTLAIDAKARLVPSDPAATSDKAGLRPSPSEINFREISTPLAAKPYRLIRCSTVAPAPQPTSRSCAPAVKPQKSIARSVSFNPPGRMVGPVTSRNGPSSYTPMQS